MCCKDAIYGGLYSRRRAHFGGLVSVCDIWWKVLIFLPNEKLKKWLNICIYEPIYINLCSSFLWSSGRYLIVNKCIIIFFYEGLSSVSFYCQTRCYKSVKGAKSVHVTFTQSPKLQYLKHIAIVNPVYRNHEKCSCS